MRTHDIAAATLFAAMVPAVAAAHVTVQPRQAVTKASQEYTVRVPTEKSAPTTSVRMTFPPGFEVLRFRRTAGWQYELERDASGRITAVTWSGGKIGRDEYEQFTFIARAAETRTYKLDAFQTYGDNDVVAWVNSGGQRPAPEITVTAPAASTSAAGADPFADTNGAAGSPISRSNAIERTVVAVSLVIAIASLILSSRRLRRSGA